MFNRETQKREEKMAGNFERESKEAEMFRMDKLIRNAQKKYDKKEDKLKQSEKGFKMTNEIKVMRDFLMEFNPFYADEKILNDMNYDELVEAMKETLKEM